MVSNPQLDGKDGNDMQILRGLSQNKMQAIKMKHMMIEDTRMKGREKWHYNLEREQQH